MSDDKEEIWTPSLERPCPVCGVGIKFTPTGEAVTTVTSRRGILNDLAADSQALGLYPQVLRDHSTPEGRETWEAVEKAAAKAPQWLRDEYEALKRKLLSDAENPNV